MKFKKKPVVIEAAQITDATFDAPHPNPEHVTGVLYDPVKREVRIPTLEGEMTGRIGDWIITGVKGERYPCKPDIFAATYEVATECASLPPFRPILDRVLCKRVEQDKRHGAIWLPDEAAERGQVFRVIEVGPGRPHHKTGRITPITVKPGDIVFSIPDMGGKKCGYPVRIGGEEFTVFEFESEIIAILTGDGPFPVGADEL